MAKEKKGMLAEFREFASQGNVIDMAVGVIIATAFGKITTSLVNDVFMPFMGWLLGDMDFTQLNIILQEAVVDKNGTVITEAVAIGIGSLIATIIDFILIAFVVFLFVKLMNRAKEKSRLKAEAEAAAAAAAAAEPPVLSAEEVLLSEIRDLLKEQKNA